MVFLLLITDESVDAGNSTIHQACSRHDIYRSEWYTCSKSLSV